MSHQEFENYLALLTRLLKVPAGQREQFAEEFRTHLEDRLDELLARGMTKEQAVPLAIGEFGDAAVLAAELAQVTQRRRRRLIMKMSYASVAALAIVGLLTFALWPEGRQVQGPAKAVAQAPGGEEAARAQPPATQASDLRTVNYKKIQTALDKEAELAFADTPLRDVVEFLNTKVQVPVMLGKTPLDEAAIPADTPITFHIKGVSLRSALRLMLDELKLQYVFRDEVLFITTQDDAEATLFTRIYDCRELLALPTPPGSSRSKAVAGGGGFFAVDNESAGKSAPAGGAAPPAAGTAPAGGEGTDAAGQFGGGGFGGKESAPRREPSDAENLIRLITTTVEPDSWDEVGGPGTLDEYKGLLVVSQTGDNHEKIERLLNMLHQAAGLKEQRVKVVE